MSTTRPSQSSTSVRSKHSARIVAQTSLDARLNAEYEESGSSFDYSRSVAVSSKVISDQPRSQKVIAYLQNIQKGKLIQPFGCLLALDEKSFKVVAFSENAPDMLTMVSHTVPSVGEVPVIGIGTDVRSIFTSPSASALQKAFGYGEVTLLNPILVHCKTSGKPFYAIIHRVTGSLIVDLEPVKPYEIPMTTAGALQSYKLAAKAIARLEGLPGGSMKKLLDCIVHEVFDLTGYDRVMAYKFHDDDHGEVVAEETKSGLEPYLGLHYPATDIPQAARFLFMKNKVRMICDCHAKPVKVLQDEKLSFDLTLCGSTLRAPHSCHLQYMENMNSIASLVMAVVINEGEENVDNSETLEQSKRKRLWGLVVCHNTSPRFVPFPLRYACGFLIQVFTIHLNKELELENQTREKNILRTQTLLCDLLFRDAPLGIILQTPNIMDLVKCDGAALLYENKIWRLGTTPTEEQIHDIALWLSQNHMDSTGLSTDSLSDAGYPNTHALDNIVCGMAAVKISPKDVLFWFRANAASEVRWGGAKHDPNDEDDGKRMHPRSSFNAFLDVVKQRSFPWLDIEMDAIHSLQLILRGTFKDVGSHDGETIHSQLNQLKLDKMEELQFVTDEMVRLIDTASVPIFAVDANGFINGWNTKIAELTKLPVNEAMGKHLLRLVENNSNDIVKRMLYLSLQGKEEQNVQLHMKTHGSEKNNGEVILVVNACASRDIHGDVVGVCFVAQDITGHKMIMDKFTRIEGDYKAIIQNPSPLIPPIFGTDEFGWCSEWNIAMTKLSGWNKEIMMDKMLLGEVFGLQNSCCRLKNRETFIKLGILLNNAMMGQVAEKESFGFYSRDGKYINCLLSVSKKMNSDGRVLGVFCLLHTPSRELQQALHAQRLYEKTVMKRSKELAYLRQEIYNPLSGITFSRKMLEDTDLGNQQKQLLHNSELCEKQLNMVLNDMDFDRIIESSLNLDTVEFTLQEVFVAAMSQVMDACERKGIEITYDASNENITRCLFGDALRLQQILADFLFILVKFTPNTGKIEISATSDDDRLGKNIHLVHSELRLTHTGCGIPQELLQSIHENGGTHEDVFNPLLTCRKLLSFMNGDVSYLQGVNDSSFIITVEFASSKT